MPDKILLIQLRQLGDILLTTPCLRELKRAYPKASISFLCHPMGRLILEGNPYLDQLLTYDPSDRLKSEISLWKALRSADYDLVLDFMYNPRSAIYARVTGAPKRLAFPSRRSWFFSDIVAQPKESTYIVREKFSYLSFLGVQPQSIQLDLPWGAKEAAWVEKWQDDEQGFREAPLRIVLSPTHRREERQWSLERFAQLADRLQTTWNATVIWIWGPGEEDFVRQAQSLCTRPTLLAPKSSFRELAALLAHCDLFIGNSNGPSHVAVAVDTPSLQLHGPTSAISWCPSNERHQALQAEPASGMQGISENDVWMKLERMRSLALLSAEARRKKVRGHWQEQRPELHKS